MISSSGFASASLDESIAFGFADPPVVASRAKPDRLLVFGLPLHHIGVACRDIANAAAHVERAYTVLADSGPIHDPAQNAVVQLFDLGAAGRIELVSGPVVDRFTGAALTYYHVCYMTSNIEATLAAAQAVGAVMAGPPKPAVLFDGRLVAFVYTPLGLVEFLAAS